MKIKYKRENTPFFLRENIFLMYWKQMFGDNEKHKIGHTQTWDNKIRRK